MDQLTCYDCGRVIDTDTEDCVESVEGNIYCESCSENLSYCGHCERSCESTTPVQVREGRNNNQEDWCDNCCEDAWRCDDCGDLITSDLDCGPCDSVICPYCYEDHYYTCDSCGSVIHQNDIVATPNGTFCADCAADENSSEIHDYNYTPNLSFHRTDAAEDRTPLFMGFELEAGGLYESSDADEAARDISEDQSDWIYCKSDGSIPSYGFELVSHPATLAAHKAYGWDNALEKMRAAGMKSHDIDNCGLHIHVNRNYLSQYRWLLIDWIVSKNFRTFEKIARRKESQWAKFVKKPDGAELKEIYGKRYGNHSYRYRAVNFENGKTVEFRLFKGTLKYDTFMATLEFIDGLVRWAKCAKIHDILQSRDAFGEVKKYIQSNPGRYNNVIQYFARKHI